MEFVTVEEGLCVQCMHMGAFDEEPRTIALMDAFLRENGYENDFSNGRMHHEIYLSDARRVPQEKWRTVIDVYKRQTQMKGSFWDILLSEPRCFMI